MTLHDLMFLMICPSIYFGGMLFVYLLTSYYRAKGSDNFYVRTWPNAAIFWPFLPIMFSIDLCRLVYQNLNLNQLHLKIGNWLNKPKLVKFNSLTPKWPKIKNQALSYRKLPVVDCCPYCGKKDETMNLELLPIDTSRHSISLQ